MITPVKWSVIGFGYQASACCNCGGNHGVKKFQKPKEPKLVYKNEYMW